MVLRQVRRDHSCQTSTDEVRALLKPEAPDADDDEAEKHARDEVDRIIAKRKREIIERECYGLIEFVEPEIERLHAEFESQLMGPENHGRLFVGSPGSKLELLGDKRQLEKQVKALKNAGESFKAVEKEITALAPKADELTERIAEQEKRIARHAELDAELKACKKIIKEIKERKEKLVEEARNKIDSQEAKKLILARWERTLYSTVEEYLAQYSRTLRSNLENLWEKYHQPLHNILKKRDEASAELAGYLKELGYE